MVTTRKNNLLIAAAVAALMTGSGFALAQGAQPGQRRRRMPVGVPPGLEVIAHENAVETLVLRGDRELEQPSWRELLGRSLVSELQHLCSYFSAWSNASS